MSVHANEVRTMLYIKNEKFDSLYGIEREVYVNSLTSLQGGRWRYHLKHGIAFLSTLFYRSLYSLIHCTFLYTWKKIPYKRKIYKHHSRVHVSPHTDIYMPDHFCPRHSAGFKKFL